MCETLRGFLLKTRPEVSNKPQSTFTFLDVKTFQDYSFQGAFYAIQTRYQSTTLLVITVFTNAVVSKINDNPEGQIQNNV